MKQVLKSVYWEMLEVLPPTDYKAIDKGNIFLVGEPTSHNEQGEPQYAMYAQIDNEYYSVGIRTVAEFKSIDLSLEPIEEMDGKTAQELELVEQYSQEAIDAYKELGIEDGLDNFEEAYVGEFESDEAFARDMAEQTGALNNDLAWPYTCIDWEFAARELMYDYSEEKGYYFRNI